MNTTRFTRVGFRTLLAVAASAVMAAPHAADAGTTQLYSYPQSYERGQADILSHTYGGTFVASGNNWSNGSVTATRVDDLADGAWSAGRLTLTPLASFSGSQQTLGLQTGRAGGSAETLLSINAYGYLPAQSTSIDLSGGHFRFTLDSNATQLRSSSLRSENSTGDQLITYKIDGLGKQSRYVMFWEDAPLSLSDRDYNDMVVEAKFAGQGGPMAVPLPPAAVMGLILMGGVGLLAMNKRRRIAFCR